MLFHGHIKYKKFFSICNLSVILPSLPPVFLRQDLAKLSLCLPQLAATRCILFAKIRPAKLFNNLIDCFILILQFRRQQKRASLASPASLEQTADLPTPRILKW